MEVEPWEALDLDDSDLPFLLRPCKRRRSISPTTAAAAAASPLTQSTLTQTPEQHCPEPLQRQPPPCTSVRRTIPGPAAAVQSAMLRKDLDLENRNFSNYRKDSGEDISGSYNCDGLIPTQEYIRRAMDNTAEFDGDFTLQPWISALQFLGSKDGVVKSTPISSIKKCLNGDKVVQAVAVIKSCTPNGLGGLIVSLKDPTGTVGASIHHKVLSGSEYGKNLTVGSVLILREVAVFAPARSTHYLNVTLRNLEKVFCQNSASTSRPNDSAYTIQYVDPGVENCGKDNTREKMRTMQNVTFEDVEMTQHPRMTQFSQNRSVIQKQHLFTKSVQTTGNVSAARKGLINLSQADGACNELPEGINRTRVSGDHQEGQLEGNVDDTNGKNESVAKSQPPKQKGSVPQWTDEQLDELFAGDDDDESLF
ncbi:uncharacterized protein c17orf53 homolog [Phtheirospermum japonicum]|uniref:Uncharacterized protein c17orf53 homolog n=1 Tax=Phtheirospermum japonicum TaxID=374723 RepID=A0A830BH77_9LAMI|nr:uncharacterized protein c17orf53 homolog [Phtheirospermum japonicum]